jgi:hypothetical protein
MGQSEHERIGELESKHKITLMTCINELTLMCLTVQVHFPSCKTGRFSVSECALPILAGAQSFTQLGRLS